MGSNDFVTLIFLVAAVLIFLQLRSVLGRRTGNEKPPFDPYSPRDLEKGPGADDNRIVTLPKRDGSDEEKVTSEVDRFAEPGTKLNTSLREIVRVDPSFSPREFIEGGRMAYEMIVMAFAEGDRKTLRNLLSREVYEGFDAAISERERNGETVRSTFVGIDKADIIHAGVNGHEEQITIRVVSQLISATYDRDGKVVDGDAEAVSEVTDIWTFARDSRSKDPNWKLVSTESEQ